MAHLARVSVDLGAEDAAEQSLIVMQAAADTTAFAGQSSRYRNLLAKVETGSDNSAARTLEPLVDAWHRARTTRCGAQWRAQAVRPQ